MKKQDVRSMVDGISERYVNEAVDRAMTGELPEETQSIEAILAQSSASEETVHPLPTEKTDAESKSAGGKSEKRGDTSIFMSKHAILALTAVAAATVIAVGVIMRDAFPKDHITQPADTSSSDTETSKPFAESSEGPYDPADENFMGGVGKLRPIGAKSIFGILVLRDDTRFYMNDGIYWQTGILPESMRGTDILIDEAFNPREQLYTLDTAVKYNANKIFTDDTAVYVQHDGALWRTDGYDETKIVTFSEVEGEGYEKNFQVTAVRRVNDDVTYLFGQIGHENAIITVENGVGKRMNAGNSWMEPRYLGESGFCITEGYVYFFSDAGTLTMIDYTDEPGDMTRYDFRTAQIGNTQTSIGWTVKDGILYYLSAEDSGIYRAKLDGSKPIEGTKCVDRENEIYFAEDCFYTVENANAASNISLDFSDFATQLCSLCRYDYGSTEQQVIATQYNYAVNPAGQWIRPLIPLAAQDGFLLYRNADNYCVSANGRSTYYLEEYLGARHSAVELASGWGGDHGSVVVKLWQNGETGTWFSPRFSLANSDGEPLPCNETEFPPTATFFPKTASSQHYSFPTAGAAYLQCEWGEWYGELPTGDYILTVYTVDPDGTTELRHDLPFMIGEDGNCTSTYPIVITDVSDTRMADPVGTKVFEIENHNNSDLFINPNYELSRNGEKIQPIGDNVFIMHGSGSDYLDSIARVNEQGGTQIPAKSNLTEMHFYIAIDWLNDYPHTLESGTYTVTFFGEVNGEPITLQTEVYLQRPSDEEPAVTTSTASEPLQQEINGVTFTEMPTADADGTMIFRLENHTGEMLFFSGSYVLERAGTSFSGNNGDGRYIIGASETDALPAFEEQDAYIVRPDDGSTQYYLKFNWLNDYPPMYKDGETTMIINAASNGRSYTFQLKVNLKRPDNASAVTKTPDETQYSNDKVSGYVQNVTPTGCEVVLKNESETQTATYGEAYYIYRTDAGHAGELVAGGEQSVFREIAYELPPGEETTLKLNWTETYGTIAPGNYALEINIQDASGKLMQLSLHID